MNSSKRYEIAEMEGIESLKLNCFSLLQNGFIPARYTSDGININPALFIENLPTNAQSLAIILEDPDVPHGNFCHWVAWNLPVTHHIKEKENRGVFGINDFCNHGYNGPHPFSITHRYHFKVYALDSLLNIPISSTKWELKQAMKNHVVGFGVVTAKYQKHILHKNGNGGTAKQNLSEELKTLLNEKNNTCVSIILPLNDLSPHQRVDKLHLSKAIKEASELISTDASAESSRVMDSLRKLQDTIIIRPNDHAIGIYVSEDINFYTTFPFPVTEKIIAGKSFHLKELLLKEHYSIPYTLVYVDEKEIRLYNGKANELNELKNGVFPMFFEEAMEINSPLINSFFARNAYIKSLDRNKSEQLEAHHKEFFKKASELLSSYFQNSEILVLCGVRKYLSEFLYHTGHKEKIQGIFFGNYSRFTEADLIEMVWPSVKNYIDKNTGAEINAYNERAAEEMTEEGVSHVWDAIASDRGETLLVERNLEIKGFVEHQNPTKLYLHPPKNPHMVLPDAVDEIIKMALDRDIKIVFVEDGMLSRNMRIALVTKF
jgi:Raf kinase inhibitor-like YbhB/YbcL family protein